MRTIPGQIIHLFIYLKSTTEGHDGHLYCQNSEEHKNAQIYGNEQTEKKNKQKMAQNTQIIQSMYSQNKNTKTNLQYQMEMWQTSFEDDTVKKVKVNLI